MLFLYLVLAVVAAASANPVSEKTILPVYEYPLVSKIIDPSVAIRSWCLDDCHHHVLDKPVFIMKKGLDGNMEAQYYPLGLNSLGQQSSLKKDLASGNMVAMVSPLGKFPHYLLDDLTVTLSATPEHNSKFSDFYKEAPVMVLLTEGEFQELTKAKTGYVHLADFAVDDRGFTMFKEHALPQQEEATVSKKNWFIDNLYYSSNCPLCIAG